jgi:hypothetical protein
VTNGKHSSFQNRDIMQNISVQVLQSAYYRSCRQPVFAHVTRCGVVSVGECLAVRMVLVPLFSGRTFISRRDLPNDTASRPGTAPL